MNILEQAFNIHTTDEIIEPDEVRTAMLTPCGVKFNTEPMYNAATDMYDSIMYVFETGEQIIVDDEENSFHNAYEKFLGKNL